MRKILVLCSILFCSCVLASGELSHYRIPTVPDVKTNYFYLGLDLGYVDNHYYNWWTDTPTTSYSVNSSGFGGRVNLGYNFNQYIGIELGALFMPEIEFKWSGDDDFSLDFWQTNLDALLKISYPMQKFEVFAKGGAAEIITWGVGICGLPILVTPTDMLATGVLGGGFGYDVTNYIMIGASYLHYFKTGSFPGTDFVSADLTFKF